MRQKISKKKVYNPTHTGTPSLNDKASFLKELGFKINKDKCKKLILDELENAKNKIENEGFYFNLVRNISDAIDDYINGDNLIDVCDKLYQLPSVSEIVELLKEKIKESNARSKVKDDLYYLEDIAFFRIIEEAGIEPPYKNLINRLVNYLNNYYEPIGYLIHLLEEYQGWINSFKRPHSDKNTFSFNVKIHHCYSDRDYIFNELKNYCLENVKCLEDYKSIVKDIRTDYNNNFNSYYHTYQSYKWRQAEEYLTNKYDEIKSIHPEGRMGGWMVIEYDCPTTRQVDEVINKLKRYYYIPGDYDYETELLLIEENIEKQKNKLKSLEKDVKQIVKDFKDDYDDWIINQIKDEIDKI